MQFQTVQFRTMQSETAVRFGMLLRDETQAATGKRQDHIETGVNYSARPKAVVMKRRRLRLSVIEVG